jgi:uncharacterized membrane protein YhhN
MTKPAVVPAIVLAVRSGGGRPSGTLATALAGSWAGDVALLSSSDAGFLGGVGGFAVAHLAYLAEIRRHVRADGADAADRAGAGTAGTDRAGAGTAARRVAAGAHAGVFGVAGAVLWRRLGTPAERRLRVPVLGYAALVTSMGAAAARAGPRAGGPAGRALAAGGAAFVVSDGLVALSHFGRRRRPAVEAAVMVTYAAAQAMLAEALAERVS